ncbi:MAG: glycoside hydrolase family 127 protein [Paludisphaera borealis]|uniref:beta-L-arabinofuranosidase domain-containing protein n=1 Tax=Paludisphaera borealis TaxID=1387353 RepID=UPI00284B876A|nr:beta-L-arabinofuranosidase domain-containing protein [Paludisphaera borealis]MDR3620425.1 glycoside hydrolase family 127 protein [Paludisphaera borealis]
MIRRQVRHVWIAALGLILGTSHAGFAEPPRAGRIEANALEPLPLGRIKPAGWLKRQLEVQAAGLGGCLDEFWPDIKSSAWIGGKAEGWERVPYWLDGLVPLAYLNDDPALKAKVKRFVDTILERQQPDGWLGPIGDAAGHQPYDPWPLFPLFKAFLQYEQATADPRVIPALLRCARKIDKVLDQTPLSSWGKMRAADFATALYALHDRVREPWLIDLARKAFAQSYDWRAHFDDFKFTGKTQGKFDLDTHGVNTAMGLKYGAVRYRISGDPKDRGSVFSMLEILDEYHGQATGMFTCDEHLAGRNPSQGTELCTVVEAMFSLETAIAITGDARLGDRLEKITFNALPATFKKDMTAHQYDQQCNQVVCKREGEHVYVDNGPDSNLYGLEPNFGCCTANFHQGWPKFVSNLWMKTPGGGLAVVAYAPCFVETEIQGKPVKVEVKTDYPFRDAIEIVVTVPEPMTFPLELRVPEWSPPLVIEGTNVTVQRVGPPRKEGAGYQTLNARWSGSTVVRFALPAEFRLYRGDHDSVAVERGPLVFALPIGAEWKKLKDNPRFADWEVYPTTPWNYALEIDPANLAKSLRLEQGPLNAGGSLFSVDAAPSSIQVKGRRLESWKLEKGAAAPPPRSPARSDAPLEELRLIPYGCTDLRITEFPMLVRSTGR